MHFGRAIIFGIAFITVLVTLLISEPEAFGLILLNEVMTPQDQQRTGVGNLNADQKAALEDWLNKNFNLKTEEEKKPIKEVFLSVNINNGQKLSLSDGSLYEIAPSDLVRSSAWITPFAIQITPSGDPDYPWKLTNPTTGSSVKGKQTQPPNS
jgi:hypothetical protein